MRWICSTIALVLTCSCSSAKQEQSAELREFAELEGALNAVGLAAPGDRPARLAEVERLEIASPRVREVRDGCAAAHRAFLDAAARMEQARERVARIESEARKALAGPVDLDASAGELASLHASAVSATDELDAALDRAESLVRECTGMRTALATEIGGH
jgi:hypothetical protein